MSSHKNKNKEEPNEQDCNADCMKLHHSSSARSRMLKRLTSRRHERAGPKLKAWLRDGQPVVLVNITGSAVSMLADVLQWLDTRFTHVASQG